MELNAKQNQMGLDRQTRVHVHLHVCDRQHSWQVIKHNTTAYQHPKSYLCFSLLKKCVLFLAVVILGTVQNNMSIHVTCVI